MLACTPLNPKVSTMIAQSVPTLPNDLAKIITGYMVEVDYKILARERMKFRKDGAVINPDVRNLLKEAFLSSYCSGYDKTFLLQLAFHPAYGAAFIKKHHMQNEMRKIFQEIADSEYRAILDGVKFGNCNLSNLNWSRASLVGAEFDNVILSNVNMQEADLTATIHIKCEWIDINLEKAQMPNVDLRHLKRLERVNFSGVTGVTEDQLSQLEIIP